MFGLMIGHMSNNNIAAQIIASRARAMRQPAETLCDALRIAIGGAWHPICAHCLCCEIDPREELEAYRAADVDSYCSTCNYTGPDVLAVDTLT